MNKRAIKVALTVSSSAILAIAFSTAAHAQDSSGQSGGLEEIIVTAQKREQSLQNVPIAITALAGDALQANRVTNVNDLSGLAPGLTVMPTAGATKVPSFTMRGAVGNGVVPGSDRQVPIYLDGIYVAASRGAIFDLPDIQRIEVLRGPQGTLFGRNATAGAVSIVTRDPTGTLGVKASATAGNYAQLRLQASIDLPQIGPFSAYISFLHNERRGDIRNTAAGQIWDRRSSADPRIAKVTASPEYLGSDNAESIFAAIKYESENFKTVYKFDYLTSDGTTNGTGLAGVNPAGPVGALINALIASQSFAVPIRADGKRPDAVANGFAAPLPQRAQGHSLTSTYQISDNLSVKNVFGYRTSYIFGASPLDGISGLAITQQSLPQLSAVFGVPAQFLGSLVGSLFPLVANNASGRTKQFSDELQFNYISERFTATAGGLWFHAEDRGNEFMQPAILSFTPSPGGVIGNTKIGRTYNAISSFAAYAQLEFHATPQLDLIAGGRVTNDKKTSELTYGDSLAALTTLITPPVKKTRFNYMLGANYKPNEDILVYGKYSTAYLGGGSVFGIPYPAETVKSWEVGVKSELFNRKLRANLAVFQANYTNIQQAQGSTTPGYPEYITAVTGDPNRASIVSTFIVPSGNLRARGFELDTEFAPTAGLVFGGSLGYTKSKISAVPALVLAAQYNREFMPIFRPEWTANVWAQYDTPKIGGSDAYVSIRGDGRWQSDMLLAPSPSDPSYLTFAAGIKEVPAYWVFNGRIALKDLKIGGAKTEIAVWGRNLTDNRSANYALNLSLTAAANYIPARTYGVDFTVQF